MLFTVLDLGPELTEELSRVVSELEEAIGESRKISAQAETENEPTQPLGEDEEVDDQNMEVIILDISCISLQHNSVHILYCFGKCVHAIVSKYFNLMAMPLSQPAAKIHLCMLSLLQCLLEAIFLEQCMNRTKEWLWNDESVSQLTQYVDTVCHGFA